MKLISLYKYASLCGITTQAVYKRKAAGKFKTVNRKGPDGSVNEYVDVDKYPPVGPQKKGSKKDSAKE